MEVGDSASGVANLGWWSLFLKRGTGECVPTTGGSHFSASPGKVYARVLERRISADSRPSDSGGTMRFSSLVVEHWTSSILSAGCLRVYGSLPNQSTCALWIWRRHSTVSLVVFCGECSGCPLSPVLFIIFMDRISRRSQGLEGVRFGNHRISSLLFADDVVLLASSSQDLQHVYWWSGLQPSVKLGWDENQHLQILRPWFSTGKGWRALSGWVERSCLQVEEFKYLGVLFTKVRERWSVRLTGGLVQRPQLCGRCTGPSW
ncbi:hypothetical protein L3Q82_009081 [Scortum barcoo]|uniref:Uncharacterized protein n=1 Tax=Scortum barcoo TaxID=214431 RepID=A0ACB8XBP0_9TELE|nr:hypothetical protein L3Q82_009081 [Scortum barcoo]